MPNRIIKQSICTSPEIDKLTDAEEVFFYRLMVNCDDFGRFEAEPEILWSMLYPRKVAKFNAEKVNNILKKLSDIKLIQLYAVDNRRYLLLSTWEKHQQRRANKSKYPEPCNQLISDDSNCNQLQANVPVIENVIENENRERSNKPPKKYKQREGTTDYATNVFLKEEEYKILTTKYSPDIVDRKIKKISNYQIEKRKGKPYLNHYDELCEWLEKDVVKKPASFEPEYGGYQRL